MPRVSTDPKKSAKKVVAKPLVKTSRFTVIGPRSRADKARLNQALRAFQALHAQSA